MKNEIFFFSSKDFYKFNGNKINILNKRLKIKNYNILTSNKLERYSFFYLDFLFEKKFLFRKKKTINLIIKYLKNSIVKNVDNFWDPYVASVRLINLIKFITFNKINNKELNSFLFHHFLNISENLEFRLRTNHLLTNLIAINLFLKINNLKTSNQSYKFEKMLLKEINLQFNKIGEHVEMSPMYQSIILEQFIDYMIISKAYGKKFDKKLFSIINSIFNSLASVHHDNNEISFFNDTNYNSKNIKKLKKLIEINFPNIDIKFDVNKDFFSNNYIKTNLKNICFLFKACGPSPNYNPGHSHADNLSFEVSYKKKKLFVNKGVSTYENNLLRFLQRSTSSHNCLEIDRQNSSGIWGSFRVGKKAKTTLIKKKNNNNFIFMHDGYSNFFNKKLHIREVELKVNSINIIDKIKGKFDEARFFLHLHPGFIPKIINNKIYILNKNKSFCVVNSDGTFIKIKKNFFYENFNKKINNFTIIISSKKPCIKTNIIFTKLK